MTLVLNTERAEKKWEKGNILSQISLEDGAPNRVRVSKNNSPEDTFNVQYFVSSFKETS